MRRDPHLLEGAVRGDPAGDAGVVERGDEVEDAGDDGDAVAEAGVDFGVGVRDPCVGQARAHGAGAFAGVRERAAGEEAVDLLRREGEAVAGEVGGDDLGHRAFAVHEHAVAVEDDEVGSHGALRKVMWVSP